MLDLLERKPFPKRFYADDPLVVARRLLGGLVIHVHAERGPIAARVVETEAYRGEEDLACHASSGRTSRTEALYGSPGYAYVYLIYGMYSMLNAVAWPEGMPGGVLVRAAEPVFGIARSTDGPGKLTKAMRIGQELHRADLAGPRLFFTPDQEIPDDAVETSRRIGVEYAGAWADRPWRFTIRGNPHVSRRPRRAKRRTGAS